MRDPDPPSVPSSPASTPRGAKTAPPAFASSRTSAETAAAFARSSADLSITPPPYLDHAAARRIVIGVLLTMLLAALDQVVVATALPTIAQSLGDADNMPWVVTANLLSATAVTPLYGKLSDIHGRRAMMLVAIGVFALGSVACALAPSMLALILSRALQGLGGGGLMPLVQTIVGDVASPKDRPRYQSYTSATFIVSMVGGPLLAGFIAEHWHWSWIFWMNLPLCAAAYLFTHSRLKALPRNERPHRLDLLGGALMVGAAVTLMLALTWGGRRFAWASWQTLALLAGSAALWLMFAMRNMSVREPFIPLSVLRDAAVRVGTAIAFFGIGAVIALTIFLPLYAQVALGLSVSESAAAIIALQGSATITSLAGGRLIGHLTHYKRVPVAALAVAIVAFVPLALAPAAFSPTVALALIALAGLGVGPMFPFTIVSIQNAVALHQLGIATGTMNFFRALGGTFIATGFGALVLTGSPLMRAAAAPALERAQAEARFGLLFGAATLCLVLALGFMLMAEERPLRGQTTP